MSALEIVGWALVPSGIAVIFGVVGFMAGKLTGYSQGRRDERSKAPGPLEPMAPSDPVVRSALRRALNADMRRN